MNGDVRRIQKSKRKGGSKVVQNCPFIAPFVFHSVVFHWYLLFQGLVARSKLLPKDVEIRPLKHRVCFYINFYTKSFII